MGVATACPCSFIMYRRSGALMVVVGVKFLTLGMANQTVNGAEKV